MMVSLAAYTPYKRTDLFGKAICYWTQSQYSHVELVIGEYCYSSSIRDGGVRRKQIVLNKEHWTVIDLPSANESRILEFWERTDGIHYGWKDLLFQQVLRFPIEDAGYFCSEWVAEALILPQPSIWTPGMLVVLYNT